VTPNQNPASIPLLVTSDTFLYKVEWETSKINNVLVEIAITFSYNSLADATSGNALPNFVEFEINIFASQSGYGKFDPVLSRQCAQFINLLTVGPWYSNPMAPALIVPQGASYALANVHEYEFFMNPSLWTNRVATIPVFQSYLQTLVSTAATATGLQMVQGSWNFSTTDSIRLWEQFGYDTPTNGFAQNSVALSVNNFLYAVGGPTEQEQVGVTRVDLQIYSPDSAIVSTFAMNPTAPYKASGLHELEQESFYPGGPSSVSRLSQLSSAYGTQQVIFQTANDVANFFQNITYFFVAPPNQNPLSTPVQIVSDVYKYKAKWLSGKINNYPVLTALTFTYNTYNDAFSGNATPVVVEFEVEVTSPSSGYGPFDPKVLTQSAQLINLLASSNWYINSVCTTPSNG